MNLRKLNVSLRNSDEPRKIEKIEKSGGQQKSDAVNSGLHDLKLAR